MKRDRRSHRRAAPPSASFLCVMMSAGLFVDVVPARLLPLQSCQVERLLRPLNKLLGGLGVLNTFDCQEGVETMSAMKLINPAEHVRIRAERSGDRPADLTGCFYTSESFSSVGRRWFHDESCKCWRKHCRKFPHFCCNKHKCIQAPGDRRQCDCVPRQTLSIQKLCEG